MAPSVRQRPSRSRTQRTNERVRCLGAPVLRDPVDVSVRNAHALQTDRARHIERQVEHVASAEEVLGARGVEDGEAVGLARHPERDAASEVGLDKAADDVD